MEAVLAEKKLREARRALAVLERAGFAARLAGGCVRDRLLGVAPKDYDIATSAPPQAVMDTFKAAGFKTVPTGVEHGTVTLIMPAGPVEITSLRVDVATDGRHAEVQFGTSFEEDAARRDFTINAMFEDRDGQIHDYCGGRADLSARCLRFVGDPSGRIREDYLRILRFFRFWARLGLTPDPAALAAIAAESDGLRRISQERITSELLQTLSAPSAPLVLQSMADLGIWAVIAPELVTDGRPPDLAPGLPKLSPVPAALRPMAALALTATAAHASGSAFAPVDLASRLRLSRADARRLEASVSAFGALAAFPEDRALVMELLDAWEQAGGEGSLERFFLPILHAALAVARSGALPDLALRARALAAAETVEAHHQALRRQKLPLSGDDVMSARPGLAGKDLGDALLALKRAFRRGDWVTAPEGLRWLGRVPPRLG